jgi:thiol-disulfide isomerase/thioredoxin
MLHSSHEDKMGIKRQLSEFLSDDFNKFLSLLVILAAVYSFAFIPTVAPAAPQQFGDSSACNSTLTVHFFYLPSCPHCKEQMPLNQQLAEEFPCAVWKYHNVEEKGEQELLLSMEAPLNGSGIHTPTTIIDGKLFVGFDREKTPGEIRAALSPSKSDEIKNTTSTTDLSVPILGRINPLQYSLISLSVLLGLLDGFNPCAMWALVYMISIAITLKDRQKFLLFVGIFLLSSGIFYFLVLSAWLNAFLFVGYLRPVMIVVGAVALFWGISSIKEFIKSKGEISCKVADAKEKKGIRQRMEKLLSSPLTIPTLLGLIFLACTIHSIEFVCSAAIPTAFTQVLSLQNLPWWQYYGYLLIYVFFYMLDDLIVFALAYYAIGGTLGDKVAAYGNIIGSVIIVVIGILLLFAPNVLMG